MTFRRTLRRCFVWLLCLTLCLGLAVPALAEDATGSEIRLLQTEGTVKVASTSGKTYSTREDMRLYNGYVVSTEEDSYAWITLDSDKAVKLDQCSSLEVRRSGKTLELLLKSGELFFNVTAPLKEDEKLNIRTSTMVTGVRGTAGWVRQVDLDHSEVGILEGRVVCRVVNTETGASRTLVIKAGQIGDLWVYEADTEGEGAQAELRRIGSMEDISGFILEEILKDEDLRKRIEEATDLDFSGLTEAYVEDRIAAEEEEIRKRLQEIEDNKLTEIISKDPLWEGDQGDGGGETFTITWNIMGSLETTSWAKGKVPYHEAPAVSGYLFERWDPTPVEAAEDATYTAVYRLAEQEPGEPEPVQYTIIWIVDRSRTEEVYDEGAMPSYPGEEPSKEGFTFVGWRPEVRQVTGNAQYTAVFEELPATYTITWMDGENVLAEREVNAGEIPEFPEETPYKEGYEFIGWDPEPVEATEDASYTAVFKELETYTITWMDGENFLTESQVYAGKVPEFPDEIPNKEGYEFVGWDPEPAAATDDATYTAVYDPIRYTVTWNAGDETVTDEVAYGDTPVYEGAEPTKADDDQFRYTFSGWDKEIVPVTEDAEYTAEFDTVELFAVILIPPDKGGSLEASAARAAEGDTVTVTPTADAGYEVVEVLLMYEQGGEPQERRLGDGTGTYTFEMPAAEVTVEAMIEAQEFELTSAFEPTDIEGASVTFQINDEEVASARTGDTVTVQLEWNGDSYQLDSDAVTVTWVDGTGAAGTPITPAPDEDGDDYLDSYVIRTYTFEMPAGNATFNAGFRRLYEIDTSYMSDYANVTVTVNGAEDYNAKEGDEVKFTLGLYDNIAIAEGSMPVVTYYDEKDGETEVPVTSSGSNAYTFTMPAGYVFINMYGVNVSTAIEVLEGDVYSGTVTVSANGTEYDASLGGILLVDSGTQVQVHVVPNTGIGYLIWTTDGSDAITISLDESEYTVTSATDNEQTDVTYTFTMPEESVDMSITVTQG